MACQINKYIAVVGVDDDDDDDGLGRLWVFNSAQETPFYQREKTGNSERARMLQLPRCAVQDDDTAMDSLLAACMVMFYVSISTVLSFWLKLKFMCIDGKRWQLFLLPTFTEQKTSLWG